MDFHKLKISQIHQGLSKKDFSAVELTEYFLKRIKEKDKEISSFIAVVENTALSQAKTIDNLISEGKEISFLAGVPFAVKDNILVEGVKATAASKILENYLAPYDATCIKKLKKEGVIILGKTNMDEFGFGASTENSAFFPTKNPNDIEKVPGGSSGGSAAAVKAGLCSIALGSDTGGSIRQPSSFCGVVGLKPTYGSVSRYGLIAFASSLDQIGPIAKTVEDAKIVFKAISGKDEMDSTSVENEIKNLKLEIKNLTIGVPKEYFVKGVDPGVEKVIKEAIKKLESFGAKIEEISLPNTKHALSAYYLIATSEASANLARYDGIKYGFSKQDSTENLLDVYLQSRRQGLGNEAKRRIMLGTYALSSGYYDAYYLKAQKIRALIKKDFDKAFKKIDIILTPVSPTLPFKLGEKINDPVLMYLSDIFTVSVNLGGLPAISIPAGFIGKLPVGLQIIGKPFEDSKILEVADFFEKNIYTNNE